jgi:hypothetical protein
VAAADHLTVPRQHGLFLHHGIDLGDGSVAHYLEGREILRSPLNDFSRGLEICVVNHPQASSAGITLRRAMSRIGEQRYNLLFNNCEHFATWCKTGRHRSGQVEDWLHTGSLGALALGEQAEGWIRGGPDNGAAERGNRHSRRLLQAGQTLADELAAVEEMEQRIAALLEGSPGKEDSEPG